MKESLLQEKAEIESKINGFKQIIESSNKEIHWQKKRLRIVEAQIESLEEKENGVPQEANN